MCRGATKRAAGRRRRHHNAAGKFPPPPLSLTSSDQPFLDPEAPSGTPAGGLDSFRAALEDLRHRLEEASRPSRFKPTEDLSLARLRLGDHRAQEVVGEIVDLSPNGLKIALAAGQPVEVDQTCHLQVGAPGRDFYELLGTVRWVDRNPYITVFGLALRDATHHSPQG